MWRLYRKRGSKKILKMLSCPHLYNLIEYQGNEKRYNYTYKVRYREKKI